MREKEQQKLGEFTRKQPYNSWEHKKSGKIVLGTEVERTTSQRAWAWVFNYALFTSFISFNAIPAKLAQLSESEKPHNCFYTNFDEN